MKRVLPPKSPPPGSGAARCGREERDFRRPSPLREGLEVGFARSAPRGQPGPKPPRPPGLAEGVWRRPRESWALVLAAASMTTAVSIAREASPILQKLRNAVETALEGKPDAVE